MIETIVKAAKEVSLRPSDIAPNVFDNMPIEDKNGNIDDPVSTKRIDGEIFDGKVTMITRNEDLEGSVHPTTNVPFERRTVETPVLVEGVFPNFESAFDAQLPEDLYKESDKKQFNECNQQLKSETSKNPELSREFTKTQMEQIRNGDTPDGFVWHHDATPGKVQLVDFVTHLNTGHTGGRAVWGGGNENR